MRAKRKYRIDLTQEDILLIMDTLVHSGDPTFAVGRQYRGKPTVKTQEHLAELYQTIGQAMGEKDITLEFYTEDHDDTIREAIVKKIVAMNVGENAKFTKEENQYLLNEIKRAKRGDNS